MAVAAWRQEAACKSQKPLANPESSTHCAFRPLSGVPQIEWMQKRFMDLCTGAYEQKRSAA